MFDILCPLFRYKGLDLEEIRLVLYFYLQVKIPSISSIQLPTQSRKSQFASFRGTRRDEQHKHPFLEAFWDVNKLPGTIQGLLLGDGYIPIYVRILAKANRPYHLNPVRLTPFCYLLEPSAETGLLE